MFVILDWFLLICPFLFCFMLFLFEEQVQVQKQKGNPSVVVFEL